MRCLWLFHKWTPWTGLGYGEHHFLPQDYGRMCERCLKVQIRWT